MKSAVIRFVIQWWPLCGLTENCWATNAPLTISHSTLNWDKRDTIPWSVATDWGHRRCPLRRQQDGAQCANAAKRNAEALVQHAWSSANFTKVYQFISCFGVFFNHRLRQTAGWRCCTSTTVGSRAKCFCSSVTIDSRQWLVTTPETGFKVVRAQQPPLTKETLPPHRHLSSLEHPPTYWLFLAVER